MSLNKMLIRFTALVAAFYSLCLQAAPEDKPMPVIAYQVQPVETPIQLKLLGNLTARQSVDIVANVTDTIQALHFEEGTQVEKGQLLVSLRSDEEQAMLEEAAELAAEAERQYQRVKDVEGKGTVTQSMIDEKYRLWKTAVAKHKVMRAQLADRRILAPFSGQVGFTALSEGAQAQAGAKIVSLDDTRQMHLELLIPSRYLASLQPGLVLNIRSEAYQNKVFKGTLVLISPRVDPVMRMVQVRAVVDNAEGLLKSNMMVQASLTLNSQMHLQVPNTALLMLGDKQFVYQLIASDEANVYSLKKVLVTTGTKYADFTQIETGLKAGDRVVSQGMVRSLKQKVTIKAYQSGQPQADLLQKVTLDNKAYP